jgi:hypothetical protein
MNPKLQMLVDAERARPDAPIEGKARAQAKLAALLGPAAGLGDAPNTAPRFGGAGKVLSSLTAAKLVGVLALGGLIGGVATAIIRPERVVYVDRAAPAVPAVSVAAITLPPRATDVESLPVAIPVPAPLAPTRAASAPSAIPSARSHDTSLAAERALIERARSALARGDGEGALSATAQHEREFAKGQLAEEREALAVQALASSGRVQEAAERGARFRKAFPTSLLLPIVDQALR